MANDPVYNPPDGAHVDLPLAQEYDAPRGNQVDLPMRADGYEPPPGAYVDLPLAIELEEWPGDRLELPLGRDEGTEPPEPFIPWEQDPDWHGALPWRDAAQTQLQAAFSYGLTAGLDLPAALPHTDTQPRGISAGIRWGLLRQLQDHRAAAWGETRPTEQLVDFAWRLMRPVEAAHALLWRDLTPMETGRDIRWLLTVLAEIERRGRWGGMSRAELMRRAPWLIPGPADWTGRIPWGFGRPPRTIVSNPKEDQPWEPPERPPPIYTPPDGAHVDLPLECRLQKLRGDRVALPFRKYQCLRSVVIVDNDVILRRVDTDEAVDCMELSISGDMDSYTNSWAAVIAREDWPIVDPLSGPVEVEATINGQKHLLLLERWAEDDVFGRDTGRVKVIRCQGRSVSAELDEPYRPAKSRYEEGQKTLVQLMQQELPEGSDWSLELHPAWSEHDENLTQAIPGGVFSYTDLPPIQAIARIAAATGAVVQQVPYARKLLIVPRYPVRPWRWNSSQADIEVQYSSVRAASAEFEPGTLHNAVYVSGAENGALVRCERSGTAGPWLEPIVDDLITHPIFGFQRAIKELGDTGRRMVYSLDMPIEGEPGLIKTGHLLSVVESEEISWNGQSIAWAISGSRSADRGLEIWQRIAVERYRDD